VIISTKIFNHSNVVIRNFTIEYRIESEELDSERDQFVCEYLEEITFTKKPDGIVDLLRVHSDISVAAALKMLGINYWSPRHSDLESVSDVTWHTFLCRDFSLMICAWDYCYAYENIFDFIDNKEQLNYPPDNPVHELVRRVRARFGFEHAAHWALKSSDKEIPPCPQLQT